MLLYILLSFVLSLLGGGLYFFWFCQRLNVLHRKYLLSTIILSSLLIPLLMPRGIYLPVIWNTNPINTEMYNNWNVVDIQDETLADCYDSAENSQDLCSCEIEQKADLYLLEPHPLYPLIQKLKTPSYYLFLGFAFLVVLRMLLKLIAFYRVLLFSEKEKRVLEGSFFYLVRPILHGELPISSFSIWNNYILVTPLFDQLSTSEQEAILLHELAHLKQKDTWQQLLLDLFFIVWWFSPIFYAFQKELDRLNEFVADEFTISRGVETKFYAHLLLKMKSIQQGLQGSLAFSQTLLKHRILYLVSIKQNISISRKYFRWGMVLVFSLFMIANAWVGPYLASKASFLNTYETVEVPENRMRINMCTNCGGQKQ